MEKLTLIASPFDRLAEHAHAWCVKIEDVLETETSVIAFGTREATTGAGENQSVVLKVIKQSGDEWRSGEILATFAGHGVARVYEQAPGAALLERLTPGNSLVDLTVNGRDEEATESVADVIRKMSAQASAKSELPPACATVEDWAKGFDNYIATGKVQIPGDLVEASKRVYIRLCATQRRPILLHGDLQHYNVLFDSDRGWLGIDPKGVVGEIEYEIGAFIRNPVAHPELFLSRTIIERRLKQFTRKLNLDYERTIGWAFAQAVLSAIWSIEDGFAVDAATPSLKLAEAIRPMLGANC